MAERENLTPAIPSISVMGPALAQHPPGQTFWPRRVLRSAVSGSGVDLDVLNAGGLTGPGIHPPGQASPRTITRGVAGDTSLVRETHARGPNKPSSSAKTVTKKVRTPSPKKLLKTKTWPKDLSSPSKGARQTAKRSARMWFSLFDPIYLWKVLFSLHTTRATSVVRGLSSESRRFGQPSINGRYS
jgi:hypothetical protein